MKNLLFITLIAASLVTKAQTADNKNNIAIGFGTQNYNGVLGNTWFDTEYEWYGVAVVNYSHYLCESFDVTVTGTMGNYGHCRDGEGSPYWPDGLRKLNMKSMLLAGTANLKYKFNNGHLIKVDAKFAPYIYIGGGVVDIMDLWGHRVIPGVCASANAGAGVRYNFNTKYSLTYNIDFAYFSQDNMDEGSNSPTRMMPMNMQNTFTLGMNF